MTVLSVIQATCDRLSLTRPATVVTSTDLQVRQLFGLLNEGATALAKRGEPGWQALTAEWQFVTTATPIQANTPIPPDFAKFVPNSAFNRTTQRPVSGPLTPQQWQLLQARPMISNMYLVFRERQGNFLIGPQTPTAGETIAYEYISSYWAKSSAGTAKAQFTSDDDMTYLDEELLTLDLKWRWKHAKGLDYGEDMRSFELEVSKALGNDGGATALNMGGPGSIQNLDMLNIPESSWPTSPAT